MARSLLVGAVSELLSQDEIRDLPSNRPRIVRHEHDGVEYVLELVRQGGGIGVGVRRATTTLRRTAPPIASGSNSATRGGCDSDARARAAALREPGEQEN